MRKWFPCKYKLVKAEIDHFGSTLPEVVEQKFIFNILMYYDILRIPLNTGQHFKYHFNVCFEKSLLIFLYVVVGLLSLAISSSSPDTHFPQKMKKCGIQMSADIAQRPYPYYLTAWDVDTLNRAEFSPTKGDGIVVNFKGNIAEVSCRERDSLALVDLFNSTEGSYWTDKWNLRRPMEMWHGVILNEEGCVESLNLHKRGLHGKISTKIGNLYNLQSLILSFNQLSGNIPPEIGNLTNLLTLSLRHSELSGNIPSELGNLSTLEELFLDGNGLTGSIPPEVGNLTKLKNIFLQRNQLSGHVPAELGKLARVRRINLSDNKLLGEIPKELGQLDSCFLLILANNQLEGCIPALVNFCTINERLSDRFRSEAGFNLVDFSNNPLLPWSTTYRGFDHYCAGEQQVGAPCNDGNTVTIKDSIGEDCRCQGQLLSCHVRDSLALIELYNSTDGPNWTVRWNLSKPMNSWIGLTMNSDGCVISLDLDGNTELSVNGKVGNNLVGKLPNELGQLSQLKYIQLNNNRLSGSIPSSICSLLDLSEINLSNNELVGNIPTEIGNLRNLKSLNLENNNLSDTLPASIYELTELVILNVSGNQLEGHIAEKIAKMKNLQECSLYYNRLSGPLPYGFVDLPALRILNIFNNNFEGCYPSQYLNLCPIMPDFSGNIALPWRGDFPKYCSGMKQIGAPCFDGDPNTRDDQINNDCECMGY